MAQWGKARVFTGGNGAEIRVLPCVDTEAFDPVTDRSPIWKILVLDQTGDAAEVAELISAANSYVGKPYEDWQRKAK